MWSRFVTCVFVLGLVALGFGHSPAWAAEPAAKAPTGASYEQQLAKAVDYLGTKGQAADGSFSAQAGPAVTALVVLGLLRNDRSVDDPMVARGLKYMAG
ncbi:MAG TPA: hypothetical protein VMF30_12300, partial [Pirellulales bacterium]|nr:hypothetical protein [Pirellulales bacterium]